MTNHDEQDDDLRAAFAALRAEDARSAPPFGRVTTPRPAARRPRRLGLVLVPVALALLVVLRTRPAEVPLPEAAVVRLAGTWRAPTDFLLEERGVDVLRAPASIPDLTLRLAPLAPSPSAERDS